MRIDEFCAFFDFSVEKIPSALIPDSELEEEVGLSRENAPDFIYVMTDDQGVFQTRYETVLSVTTAALFESMQPDYIDGTLDDYGFDTDGWGNYYEEALKWIEEKCPDLQNTDTHEVIKVLTGNSILEDAPKSYIEALWTYQLQDDSSPTGGIAHSGETLGEFLESTGEPLSEKDLMDTDMINNMLANCGIAPVMMSPKFLYEPVYYKKQLDDLLYMNAYDYYEDVLGIPDVDNPEAWMHLVLEENIDSLFDHYKACYDKVGDENLFRGQTPSSIAMRDTILTLGEKTIEYIQNISRQEGKESETEDLQL